MQIMVDQARHWQESSIKSIANDSLIVFVRNSINCLGQLDVGDLMKIMGCGTMM
jgi:hypothetical protein